MTWDTIIVLALFAGACIYCIRKVIRKTSACSCTTCSSKDSCAGYYNYKEIPTQCSVKKEEKVR